MQVLKQGAEQDITDVEWWDVKYKPKRDDNIV